MTMNNSDFLSDAVALDLGKSGVKVAETLEIEVGTEWWRLINAADVTDAAIYSHRYMLPPPVSEGKLHLGGFESLTKVMDPDAKWNFKQTRHGRVHTIVVNNEPYFYSVGCTSTMSGDPASYGEFRVWDAAGNTIVSKRLTANSYDDNFRTGAYWDNVNSRFVVSWKQTYAFNLAGAQVFYSGNAFNMASDFWTVEVFPESPGAIYSFFLSTAGGAKVKKHIPVYGVNVRTQAIEISNNNDATALPAITNFSLADGLHPFFLRAAESAGVAWVDATTRQVCYVLESESWATIHYLPPEFLAGSSLIDMGALYIPGEGEFFLMAHNRIQSGNVGTVPGYSFPENLVIFSSYHAGVGIERVFGVVGTTIHVYDFHLSSMLMEYLGVASTTWNYQSPYQSHLLCTKVAESGGRDLLIFTNSGWFSDVLVLYDRASHTFVWEWTFPKNNSIFPTTMPPRSSTVDPEYSAHFFLLKTNLLAYCAKYKEYGWQNIETILIPLSSFFGAANASDVTSAIQAAGVVKSANPISVPGTYDSLKALLAYDACLKHIHYDNGVISLFLGVQTSNSALNFVVKINEADRSIVTTGGNVLPYPASTSCLASVIYGLEIVRGAGAAEKIDRNSGFLYTNNTGIADTDFRHFYSWVSSGVGYISARVVTENNTWYSLIANNELYVPWSNGYYTMRSLMPAAEEKGCSVIYQTRGANLVIAGAYRTLDPAYNFSGVIVPLPFTTQTFNYGFTNEWEDTTVLFSSLANGVIKYAKFSGNQGVLDTMRVVRVRDNCVFDLDLGQVVPGGINAFNPNGSYLNYIDMTGRAHIVFTGASQTEGLGETGVVPVQSPMVYQYLSRNFIPYPFAREGIRAELSNISKTTKITLPETQDNLIRGMLAAGTDFRGSRCILRRVFPDHLDEVGSDIVLLDGYIQDWSYVPGKKGIAFSVSKTLIDVRAQFPKRLMNMGCSHVFKGTRCRYLGEEGRCLKTRAFCTSIGNLNQFGGFPWVAARQRRVMWK